MGYDLQLQIGGILVTKEWDSELNDFMEFPVEDEDITFHLHDSICLERGVKLRDVFLFISRNLYLFSTTIGCPFLDDLVEEALSSPNIESKGIAVLVLDWAARIENKNLISYVRFYGKGDKDYPVEFHSVNDLVIYPIILNETFAVMDEDKVVFQAAKQFSLLEFLKGIVDELSYMGPPEMKKFTLNEIEESINQDGSKIKMFNAEDIEEKLNEKIASMIKPCKICGDESRSPFFGKPSDICIVCFEKMKEN